MMNNTRITFWGERTPDPHAVMDLLLLVNCQVHFTDVVTWTPLERLLAFDWAARVHFHASDNPVRMRPKPSFVKAANEGFKAFAERHPKADGS